MANAMLYASAGATGPTLPFASGSASNLLPPAGVSVQLSAHAFAGSNPTSTGLVVTADDSQFHGATLDPGVLANIAQVASAVAACPGMRVEVNGFSDIPAADRLATERAMVLRDALVRAVVLFPVMVLGAWVGGRLFHGLASERLYRNVALVILFATGLFGLLRDFIVH